MYKVKYSTAALNIIDRQNIYNIIFIVRSIIKLFRLRKYQKELY